MHQSRLVWLVVARAGAWAPAPPTRRRLAACQAEAGLDAASPMRRGLVGGAVAATLVEPARADDAFPGTAEDRRRAVAARIKELGVRAFAEPWPETRRNLLYAGGLKDAPQTKLAFSDYNHCDLTCMAPAVMDESNADGKVEGVSTSNKLGDSIRANSLADLGPGGSWATCMIGCASEPPRDVAHVQFKSRIAFKLVWTPGAQDSFRRFVLVDDEGVLLASGAPTGNDLPPPLAERKKNFALVEGSKYARAATIFRWPDVYDPTFTVEEK